MASSVKQQIQILVEKVQLIAKREQAISQDGDVLTLFIPTVGTKLET